MVVDFDDQFTQLSADATSSYFDIWMNGLEPERYYAILIKSEISMEQLKYLMINITLK
jgi:hypothetical protein